MTRILYVLMLAAALGAAQTLTENAIAAAGGSAAGVGGKAVSNGIDVIFGKLATQTAEAAEITPSKPAMNKAAASSPAPEQPGLFSGGSKGGARRLNRNTPAGEQISSLDPPRAAVAPQPVPANPEALAAIAPGTARRELLAKGGSPASRIVMGDGGHLVEIYRYTAHSMTVASVRLEDGSVVGVQMMGAR